MTLRDIVRRIDPAAVGDCFVGGVAHCPGHYSYLNSPTLVAGSEACLADPEACTHRCYECWGQEARDYRVPCKWCFSPTDASEVNFSIMDDSGGRGQLVPETHIKFCPFCGRLLQR